MLLAEHSQFLKMVTSAGFGPANAALRGLRLKPLVDEAKTLLLEKPY